MPEVEVANIVMTPLCVYGTGTETPCREPATFTAALGGCTNGVYKEPYCEPHAKRAAELMATGTAKCNYHSHVMKFLEAVPIKPTLLASSGVLDITFDERDDA